MFKQQKAMVSQVELAVLRTLKVQIGAENSQHTDISELSSATGVRDNDEILRALYTLEGKNLVQPEPPGDLTSSIWKITDGGVKALQMLQS